MNWLLPSHAPSYDQTIKYLLSIKYIIFISETNGYWSQSPGAAQTLV